jgi:hypothetical protein
LASKLVGSNSSLSEIARLNSLCNIARCQLCEVVGPKLYLTNRLELENQLYRTARPELELRVARPKPDNSLLEAEL